MKLLIFVALCLFLSGINAQIRWEPASWGRIPVGAVLAGHERGFQIYVCRLSFRNVLVSGYLDMHQQACFATYQNQHLWMRDYDVAVGRTAGWVQMGANSAIPRNAVHVGISSDRQTSYACRATQGSNLISGSVVGGRCFMTNNARTEAVTQNYSILVDTSRN